MNHVIFKRHGILIAACLCLLIGFAASADNAQVPRRVINVKTVGQLYAAVNNSANRNVTVRLAPGTYSLSTYTKNNVLRRNRGALRMPPGMSLVGSEKRVLNGDGVPVPISDETPDDFAVPGTETIIDGSALDLPFLERKDCTGLTFFAPNPVIYVGFNNLISHLTVFAGNHVAITEPTDDPVDPNGNLSMTIKYSVLEGWIFALGFSNCGCTARRARSVLTLTHSVVRRSGVLIQNFLTGDATDDPSHGPAIWATVTSNLFYDDGFLRASGGDKGTDGGTTTLYMSGNVFKSGGGFLGLGSVSRDEFRAVGNRLNVRSEFDTFGESVTSNVSLEAARSGAVDDPQGSRVEAAFIHPHFIRDFPEAPPAISIFGGGGSHSRVEVLVRGATVKTSEGVRTEAGFLIQDNFDPAIGSTKARLEGSREEFLQRNQGLAAPPAKFFLEHPHSDGS